MRALFLAAALLIPAPALAVPPTDAPIADSLPSRGEVERYGAVFNNLIGVLLGVDVGPIADAIDPTRPNAGARQTIGDLARRNDPDFDRRLRVSTGALADTMGVLQERMRVLEPQLRRSLKDIERSVDEATRDLPQRGRYEEIY